MCSEQDTAKSNTLVGRDTFFLIIVSAWLKDIIFTIRNELPVPR